MLIRITCFCYSALLFYIFFLARRRPSPSFLKDPGHFNLLPFKNKYWYLIHQQGLPPDMVAEFYKDLCGNVILFIPLPFFLLSLTSVRTLTQVMIFAFAISLSVEITQYILSIGLADIDDLLLNSLGAYIGFCLFTWLDKRRPGIFF